MVPPWGTKADRFFEVYQHIQTIAEPLRGYTLLCDWPEELVADAFDTRNVAGLVDLPRKVHRDLPMISYQQTRAFIRACRNRRLESLFILAIATGARQGELLGLT